VKKPTGLSRPPRPGMERWKVLRRKFGALLLTSCAFMLTVYLRTPTVRLSAPSMFSADEACSSLVATQTITPLPNTPHLLVSAFADRRVQNFDVRIIGIFRRDSVRPLVCVFCCSNGTTCGRTTPAQVLQHSDNFGYPYVTTDVMCRVPPGCQATHATLVPEGQRLDAAGALNGTFLPIRNRGSGGVGPLPGPGPPLNLTVCISNIFGSLLGVNRVVVYNTSSGPDLTRLLRGYAQEGFVEVVPWPIDRHLTPSSGWQPAQNPGDVHYYGQLTTLNECVYRSMERSRYVLLHDIDEIVVPYRHADLVATLYALQQQHPKVPGSWSLGPWVLVQVPGPCHVHVAGTFLIENHIFPKNHFEPSGRFHLPQWEGVPGVNILEHVYREEPNRKLFHPYKIIVRPRSIEQTSVHSVLHSFDQSVVVPPDVCHLVHVRTALQGQLSLSQLHVDKRLWDFSERLVPGVDRALRRAGLLRSEVTTAQPMMAEKGKGGRKEGSDVH
ncbi:hypothetical protein CRUP_030154, partial [Coryphaenoides rupestris]